MGDLKEMIERYSVKQDRYLKKICAPLKDSLNIGFFAYYKIGSEGQFSIVSTHCEQLSFYYSHPSFYLHNPYLVHPSLLRTGCAMVCTSFDPDSIELMYSHFGIKDLFLIQQSFSTHLEGYLFFCKESESPSATEYLNMHTALKRFLPYFKHACPSLLSDLEGDHFNLKQAKGEAFFQSDPLISLSNQDPHIKSFLKTICPLSLREEQCLELYKEGRSAQATAALLDLSNRTVESYFESIKNKLGCTTKSELLEW